MLLTSQLPVLALCITARSAALQLICSASIVITGCLRNFLCLREELTRCHRVQAFPMCSAQARSGDPSISYSHSSRQSKTATFLLEVQVYTYRHRSMFFKHIIPIRVCVNLYKNQALVQAACHTS